MCFFLQRGLKQKIKKERQDIHEKLTDLEVRSVFLACLIQSKLLYFLTGTFIGKSVIISL